jgi:ribosome biogenesis GTPase
VVVGDRVTLRISDSRQGVIEEILPRSNLVTRVSETEPFKTRVMAANLDALGIILAIEPFPPRWVLADRMLVLAEQENLMAFIVINKIDLLDPRQDRTGEVRSQAEVYQKLGVAICWTSALRGDGMERLESLLKNRLTAFAGHSGVGKTSLLNRLVPEIHLEVAGVNPLTLKGRQTTTTSRLVSLKCGGYIVDTPGFREFGLGRIQAAELGRFFPEFRPVISQCRFSDCLHQQEPGCALVPAVEQGLVSKLRYQNYLQILSGLVEPSS